MVIISVIGGRRCGGNCLSLLYRFIYNRVITVLFINHYLCYQSLYHFKWPLFVTQISILFSHETR